MRYENVKFFNEPNELISNCNLLAQVNCPKNQIVESIKDNTIILGILNPHKNKEAINNFIKKKN